MVDFAQVFQNPFVAAAQAAPQGPADDFRSLLGAYAQGQQASMQRQRMAVADRLTQMGLDPSMPEFYEAAPAMLMQAGDVAGAQLMASQGSQIFAAQQEQALAKQRLGMEQERFEREGILAERRLGLAQQAESRQQERLAFEQEQARLQREEAEAEKPRQKILEEIELEQARQKMVKTALESEAIRLSNEAAERELSELGVKAGYRPETEADKKTFFIVKSGAPAMRRTLVPGTEEGAARLGLNEFERGGLLDHIPESSALKYLQSLNQLDDPASVTGFIKNFAKDKTYQSLPAKDKQWVADAIAVAEMYARTVSGAVLSGGEVAQAITRFMNMPGDGAQEVIRKAKDRQALFSSLVDLLPPPAFEGATVVESAQGAGQSVRELNLGDL